MEYPTHDTKEVTIYDIAKELNISPATVSRGLNDHAAVNKNTKKKILAVAKEMGYRSNTFASNLRRQRTHTIGVILPHLNSNFLSAVIAGMEKVANEAGYNLLISQSLETEKKEIANAKTMFDSRVDGLLVSLAANTASINHFEPFIKKGVPIIFFDRVFEHKQCTSIVIDNVKAGYEATTHLIAQGGQKIVHITGNLSRNVYADRLKGYKFALLENGLPYQDENVYSINLTSEIDLNKALNKILNGKALPNSLFVANDSCAVSCIKFFKKAGIRIPQDIAIVGFNNDPLANVIEPNLTTIDYPGCEMGEVAAKNLINHLNGVHDINSTNTIILRSGLIIRESSQRKSA